MASMSAQSFSFGQLMIAAAVGAIVATAMMVLYVLAKHDALRAELRYAEDGHRQASRLLALQASASGYLVDGRYRAGNHDRLPGVLRSPTQAMKELQAQHRYVAGW